MMITTMRTKLIRFIGILCLLYIGASTVTYLTLSKVTPGYGDYDGNTPAQIIHPLRGFESVDTSPYRMPTYRDVSFPSIDPAITISGWMIPREHASNTIIIVPGLNASKASPKALICAGMLWRNGFNVLIIDVRDQGKSTIEDGKTALGTTEYNDVLGAKKWLISQGFSSENIGVMGASLGGATALIAFGEDPSIPAAFIDSSFSDPISVIYDELARHHYPQFLARGGIIAGRVISGDDLVSKSPIHAVQNGAHRSLMLVHSRGDHRVLMHHETALEEAARWGPFRRFIVWINDSNGHCDMMFEDPMAYEQKLVGFFKIALPTANMPHQ